MSQTDSDIDRTLSSSPFDTLLNAAADGIIVISDYGLIEIINPAAENLFGYQKGELIGENVSLLMPQPDRTQHNTYLSEYLKTGIRKMIGIGRKTVGQKKDKSCFPMYLSVGHVEGVDRHRFVGIIRDLTDEENNKNAAEQSALEIRQLRERLTHVARISTLGEMATGIAHEINQPLTAIATYAQACQRLILSESSANPDAVIKALDRISDQAQRASKIISGIRQLSKKQTMTCTDCGCIELINGIVALAEIYAHEKEIKIQVEVEDISEATKIRVDNIQTQQVLLNILNNAIESMEGCSGAAAAEDQLIIVRVSKTSDTALEIAVIDRGHGIKAEHQDQLFDAFFTTKNSGLGMGLSICQSIITSQGGEIQCWANERSGTTFAVTLPLSIGKAL